MKLLGSLAYSDLAAIRLGIFWDDTWLVKYAFPQNALDDISVLSWNIETDVCSEFIWMVVVESLCNPKRDSVVFICQALGQSL